MLKLTEQNKIPQIYQLMTDSEGCVKAIGMGLSNTLVLVHIKFVYVNKHNGNICVHLRASAVPFN